MRLSNFIVIRRVQGLILVLGMIAAPVLRADPTYPGQWIEIDSMRQPRWGASAEALNGKIFVIGGNTSTDLGNPLVTDSVHSYDPETGDWEALACMPVPLYLSASTIYNRRIFIIGGLKSNGDYSNQIFVFDPNQNQWFTATTELPFAMAGSEAVTVGDSIFLIGGRSDIWVNSVFVIDPMSWNIHAGPPMPHARAFSGAALVEDTIIMAVGGKWYQEHWYVDYLNVKGTTWAESTSLPTARAYHSSVATGHYVFCIGGQSGEDVLDEVIVLTDSGWIAHPEFPHLLHKRAGHSSVILDTMVYVLGGYRQSEEQWIVEPTVEAFSVSKAVAESFEEEQIGPLLRFPNPLTPRHTIHLASSSSARVRIYTSTGRLLRDFEVQESFRLSNVLSNDIRRSTVLFLRVNSGGEEQCFKCLLFP